MAKESDAVKVLHTRYIKDDPDKMASLEEERVKSRIEATERHWMRSSEPPEGEDDCWSREVVVLSNYGDIFQLMYFNSKDGGCWQRPARFNKGEEVEWWIDKPEGY